MTAIEKIAEKQDAQELAIEKISDQNIRILSILENDEKTNTKGAVQQIRDNTEDIKEINQDMLVKKTRERTIYAIWGVIITAISIYLNIKK